MLGRLPFGRRWLSPACAVLFAAVPAGAVTKVGCVGDSITAGYGLSSTDQAYPSRLGVLLGSGYEVKNYGESGAAVSKASDKPYWTQPSYAASTQYDADIVVIMLGTNDAKPSNWSLGTFTTDYSALVQHYVDLGAKVFLATPPPVFDPGAYSIDPHTLNDLVVADVRQMAADQGSLPLIDVYAALDGQSSLFPDTVHPNAAGAQLIANTVGAAILAAAGGNGGASGGNGGASGSSASAGGGAGGLSPGGGAGGVFESGGRAPVGGQGAGGAAANAGGTAGSGNGAGGTGGRAMGGTSGGERAGAPGNGAGGDATAGAAGTAGSLGVGAVGGAGAGRRSGAAGVSDEPAGEPSSSDDSGCGCRTAVHGSPRWRWAWLAVAAFAVAARRRTRRR